MNDSTTPPSGPELTTDAGAGARRSAARRRSLVATAVAAAVSVALAATLPAAHAAARAHARTRAHAAAETICADTINHDAAYEALVVPKDKTCRITEQAHIDVSGDVRVEKGAKLVVARFEDERARLSVGKSVTVADTAQLIDPGILTVKGDVTATSADDVYLIDAKIGGNLDIGPWGRNVQLAGISVDGTVSIHQFHLSNASLGVIEMINSRMGELAIKDNKDVWELTVADNRIERRLDCVSDHAHVFFFERNTVAGKTVGADACPAPSPS